MYIYILLNSRAALTGSRALGKLAARKHSQLLLRHPLKPTESFKFIETYYSGAIRLQENTPVTAPTANTFSKILPVKLHSKRIQFYLKPPQMPLRSHMHTGQTSPITDPTSCACCLAALVACLVACLIGRRLAQTLARQHADLIPRSLARSLASALAFLLGSSLPPSLACALARLHVRSLA